MMERSKRWTRWVLLLGLSTLTGCSTKPVYDEGPILELYPSRFEDGLLRPRFFQFFFSIHRLEKLFRSGSSTDTLQRITPEYRLSLDN